MNGQSSVAPQMGRRPHSSFHQPRTPRPIGTLRIEDLREAAWLIVHAVQRNKAVWSDRRPTATYVFIARDLIMYAIPESSPFARQWVNSQFPAFMGCYVPPSNQRSNCLPSDVDGLIGDLTKHVEEVLGRKL